MYDSETSLKSIDTGLDNLSRSQALKSDSYEEVRPARDRSAERSRQMYDSETSLKSIDTGSYNLSRPQSLKSESYEDVGSARDRSAESSRQMYDSETSLKLIDIGSYNLSRSQSLKSESYEEVGPARDSSSESSRQMYDSETSLKSIDTGSYNLSRPQSLKSESYEDVGSARDRSAESSRQHSLSVISSTKSLFEESNYYEEVNTDGHFDPSILPVFNDDTISYRPRRHNFCAFVIRCTLFAILFVVVLSTSSLLAVKLSDKPELKQYKNITCAPCGRSKNRKGKDTEICCYSTNDINRRERKKVNEVTPHFYLEGIQGGPSRLVVTDWNGIFKWRPPTSRSFNRDTDLFHATVNSGSLVKVRIMNAGMYYIFAKVTALINPLYSDYIPPVWIRLMKNNDILEESWMTQEERGKRYSRLYRGSEYYDYRINTVTIFGLHELSAEDEIYIQRSPDLFSTYLWRFLNSNNKGHFGAFVVERCLNCVN